MKSLPWVLALAAATFHAGAEAQMFKCKGADGRVAVQDTPCAAGSADLNPRPALPARDERMVPRAKDSRAGANWDLGPRPERSSLPPAPAPAVAIPSPAPIAAEPRQRKASDFELQQARMQEQAEAEKARAFNQMVRCNQARQQLGVAKSGRAISSYDNKGERHYVPDEKRDGVTASLERRVAEECQ